MAIGRDKKTGKWYYYGSIYHNGKILKRYKKRGFATSTSAKIAEAEFLKDYEPEEEYMPLKMMIELYLEYHKQNVKMSTYTTDKYVYDKIAKEINGDYRKKEVLQDFIDSCDERYSKSQVSKIYSCVSKMFKWALRNEYISRNPMDKIYKSPRKNERKKEMNFFEPDEFKAFIAEIDDLKYQTIFITLYYMGMRKGELAALTWKDIDLRNCTIRIDKTVDFKNGRIITNPKTNNSYRTITMPNIVKNKLKEWHDVCSTFTSYSECSLVFFNEQSTECILSQNTLRRRLLNGIERANEKGNNIPKIRVHDLRHSHASYLINNMSNGFTDYDIAQRLGDTVETLHNTYAHWFRKKDDSIISFMNMEN